MGPFDKMTVFTVLIIVMILACVCRVRSWQESGRLIFLEAIFGRVHFLNEFNVLQNFR
jgi:hypothetical protein